MRLNGITVPEGQGIVLEVHLDLQKTSGEFSAWLNELGFEDDPFATFFPKGYVAHMTGRLRVQPKELVCVVREVNTLVAGVVSRALSEELALYTEVELVRQVYRFDGSAQFLVRGLDSLAFQRTGKFGGAKSDVHVEFPAGQVSQSVHAYLVEKHFYWVSTPATDRCAAEDIATLQTSEYLSGQRVAEILAEHPLPECTAIHLEQKLSMVATNYDLKMPEVIAVR